MKSLVKWVAYAAAMCGLWVFLDRYEYSGPFEALFMWLGGLWVSLASLKMMIGGGAYFGGGGSSSCDWDDGGE